MLERPIDVKVGPDGYLYVLDFGRLDPRGGKTRITAGSGQVFRLRPTSEPTTLPAAASGQ
jgi:glucose/arabinose dehydrogenase